MIKHLVLFKLKEGFTPETPQVQEVTSDMAAIGKKLPMVKEWIFGPDTTHRPISYDYALITSVENREDLQAYIQHPEHQAIVKRILEVSTYIVADLEI